jgi:hypothetical protein
VKEGVLALLSSMNVGGVHVQSTKLQEEVPEVADRIPPVFGMLSVYMSTTLTDVAPGLDVATRDESVRLVVFALWIST